MHHSKTEPITQNRINQLYWIIDKITVNFSFNFFGQWLQQAGKGVCEVRVPNWHQINQMVECSFPQMAFNYSVAPGDGTLIECYFKPETTEPFKYKCLFITGASKHALRKMKSYTPPAVAMMVYNNPTEQNKELQRYVDKYVRKLLT
ncbi:hypothetical protein [Paenibacillus agricola]|uniref:Uncharacterized protein n=1 Tax=Paenibacillus agricola TaxID=2716264 RepID=A0ABX0JHA4_9BACL|nr:hypothetical protein [Paenibacillus agricola]NHN34669.1 hypothetical protein [Paenibacillus agricola]